MIEETVFIDFQEIKEVVKSKYGLEITNVAKIERGSANIYSLNNDKYILKEFQSKYKKEEIIKEIEVIKHLEKNDIKVPHYVKLINGDYCFVHKEKYIILQEYIDGYTLEQNGGNYFQTIESAEYLGRIVKALETINYDLSEADLSAWYSDENFDKSIDEYNELIRWLDLENETEKRIYDELNEKIEMINSIRNSIDFEEMSKLSIKATHGDYSVMQFIYKEDKINAVIDFVSACKMPIVWELLRSYSYIDKDAKDGDFNINTMIDYVKKFNEYVKLNEYDIKYMSYLYLLQLLNSSYGYKQYINNKSNIGLLNFAFLRTKICKYLFNNAKLISQKLEEEL